MHTVFHVVISWPRHGSEQIVSTHDHYRLAQNEIIAKYARMIDHPEHWVESKISDERDYIWCKAKTGGPKSSCEIVTYHIQPVKHS